MACTTPTTDGNQDTTIHRTMMATMTAIMGFALELATGFMRWASPKRQAPAIRAKNATRTITNVRDIEQVPFVTEPSHAIMHRGVELKPSINKRLLCFVGQQNAESGRLLL